MARLLFVLAHIRSRTDLATPKNGPRRGPSRTAPMNYHGRLLMIEPSRGVIFRLQLTTHPQAHGANAGPPIPNQDIQTTNLGVGRSNRSGRANDFNGLW